MGVVHGKDGVVKSGAVTVAKTTKFTINEQIGIDDASAQGEDFESHNTGMKKATGTVDSLLNDADAGQATLTIGAQVTLNLYPDGAGSGARYFTGTVTITGINTDSDKTANNKRSFSWESNGTYSWATV